MYRATINATSPALDTLDDKRLRATSKEIYLNEERRLAHVAATRAKDKLVFTMYQNKVHKLDACAKKSEFEAKLRKLPESVFLVIRKSNKCVCNTPLGFLDNDLNATEQDLIGAEGVNVRNKLV